MDAMNTTVFDYNICWNNLCNSLRLDDLKLMAKFFQLGSFPFRTICWKIFLNYFKVCDVNYWIKRVDSARICYDELLKTLTLHPHDHAPSDDNPLSQAKNSVWRQYLSDIDLRQIIKNDVVRTQVGDFVCDKENVSKMMVNILFCYAKKNPDISYKQGMHEILAYVILSIKREQFMFLNHQKQGYENDTLKKLYDPKYLEHDAYEIFSCIMESMKYFYDVEDYARENITHNWELSESTLANELKYLQNSILATYAADLEHHLRKLNIEFTSFGIRWIRLLFGREFPSNTVFLIWDVIFAHDKKFSMVYYIFFAMLIWISRRLLNSSYIECLEDLMHYPSINKPREMISFALRAREKMIHTYDHSMKFVSYRYDDPIRSKLAIPDLTPLEEPTKLITKSTKRKVRCHKASFNPYSTPEAIRRVRLWEQSRRFASAPSKDLIATEASTSNLSALSVCRLSLAHCTNKLTEHECHGNEELQGIISKLNDISLALDNVNGIKTILDGPKNSSVTANELVTLTRQQPMICAPVVDPLPVTSHLVALNLPPPRSEVNMTVFKRTEQPTEGNESQFPRKNPLNFYKDRMRDRV